MMIIYITHAVNIPFMNMNVYGHVTLQRTTAVPAGFSHVNWVPATLQRARRIPQDSA